MITLVTRVYNQSGSINARLDNDNNDRRATVGSHKAKVTANGKQEWYLLRFGVLVSPATPQVFNEFRQEQDLFETLDGLDASASSHDGDDAFHHLYRIGSDRLAVLTISFRFTTVSRRCGASRRKGLQFPFEPTTETHLEHPTTGN